MAQKYLGDQSELLGVLVQISNNSSEALYK